MYFCPSCVERGCCCGTRDGIPFRVSVPRPLKYRAGNRRPSGLVPSNAYMADMMLLSNPVDDRPHRGLSPSLVEEVGGTSWLRVRSVVGRGKQA